MSEDMNRESMRLMRALALVWTTAILMIGILPLDNFVGHSHWDYVHWVPTLDDLHSPRYLFDIVANTILFIPYGYCLVRALRRPIVRSLRLAVGSAVFLSSAIEFYQVYCHNRNPSPLDIATNVLGSLIGALVVVLIGRMRHIPPSDRITPIPPARTLVP